MTFDHPEYISYDADFPDTLVFTFNKSDTYLIPEVLSMVPVEDGY